MEDQCSSLSWAYCYQEEGMEELKHTLLFTTLELETTLMAAKEEITRREIELAHLKDVLTKTLKERDEARDRCQKLIVENFIFQQQMQETASFSGVSSSEDGESKPAGDSNKLISSSESKGSMNSSRSFESISAPAAPVNPPVPSQPPQSSTVEEALKLAANRPLPVKGKLLQAVKDAGPLLHNLLLAGPLPQWQHPPPQLTSVDIPPVAISSPTQQLINQDSFNNLNGCLSKKRGLENHGASDSSPKSKNQKACSPLNNSNYG